MSLVTSRIDTVTLYNAGATVRRLAEVPCPTGAAPTEVELISLPLSLVDASVRVRVSATTPARAAVTAGAVRPGLYVPPRGAPSEAPSVAELREAQHAYEAKRDAIAALEAEIELLTGIPVPGRPDGEPGKLPPPSPMSARITLEQLTEEGVTTRLAQLRALSDEAKVLADKVSELQRKVELASSSQLARPDELTKSLIVRLIAAPGTQVTSLTLELEYFVRAARWAPAYQCRMARDCLQAELQMRALVWQRSGEDWSRALLRLSTAAPLSWTELPELSSIRIGKQQPPPPSRAGFRPPPVGAEPLFADYDSARALARAQTPAIPSWQPPTPPPAKSFAGPPPAPAAEMSSELADMDDGDMLAEEEAAPAPRRREREEMKKMAPAPAMMRVAQAPVVASRSMSASGAALAAPKRSKVSTRDLAEGEDAESLLSAQEQDGATSLSYLRLELGSPTHSGDRGKLHAVDTWRLNMESLARREAMVNFDVRQVVLQAQQASSAPPARAGVSDVRALAGNFDFVYPTEERVDVPSDGGWHSVPVGARVAKASVLYVAVPREDSHVYREAVITNPISAPMLSGPVDVYVADEFVLATTLKTVPPGGDFKLGLGVEQAIKVARNTKYEEKRSGDKVVATSDLLHDIDIEVVNRLEREIRCEVRERIPQPAPDAEVVVEEVKVSPPWQPYPQTERGSILEGGRKWLIAVPAGQTQKLSARYVVKLYANNELVGGNRREA